MAMLQFEEIKKTSRKHNISTLFFLTSAQISTGFFYSVEFCCSGTVGGQLPHTYSHCTFFFSFFFFVFFLASFLAKPFFVHFFVWVILVTQKVSLLMNGLNDREGEKNS